MQRISFTNRVSVNEAARLLYVHRSTVWRWIERGWLVARHRPDGTWIRYKAIARALNHPRIKAAVANGRDRYWRRVRERAEADAEAELVRG